MQSKALATTSITTSPLSVTVWVSMVDCQSNNSHGHGHGIKCETCIEHLGELTVRQVIDVNPAASNILLLQDHHCQNQDKLGEQTAGDLTCKHSVVLRLVDILVISVSGALVLQEGFEPFYFFQGPLQAHIPCLGINLALAPVLQKRMCLLSHTLV